MSDEVLPAIVVHGYTWKPMLRPEPPRTSAGFTDAPMTFRNLCALVAALPEAQLESLRDGLEPGTLARRVMEAFWALGEHTSPVSSLDRVTQAIAWKTERDTLTAENARLREELAHARRAERERCAAVVNAIDAPPETTDANIGTLRGLCLAEQAIRALKDEP